MLRWLRYPSSHSYRCLLFGCLGSFPIAQLCVAAVIFVSWRSGGQTYKLENQAQSTRMKYLIKKYLHYYVSNIVLDDPISSVWPWGMMIGDRYIWRLIKSIFVISQDGELANFLQNQEKIQTKMINTLAEFGWWDYACNISLVLVILGNTHCFYLLLKSLYQKMVTNNWAPHVNFCHVRRYWTGMREGVQISDGLFSKLLGDSRVV